MSLSDRDGEKLVKTARAVVTEYLKNGEKIILSEEFRSKFSYNSGVFVTLNKEENLRGCIGFPTPVKKLYQSLADAAVAAATEDPRFSPVTYHELEEIFFEVTVLATPKEVKVKTFKEYLEKIKVGRDGLIIKWEFGSGLLLPQVPIEYCWTVEEFLNHACEKAGAPQNCWKEKSTRILSFEGVVFRETKPRGDVVRVIL